MALWTAGDVYVALFGVPGSWSWLFVLPLIVITLAVAAVVAIVRGWRRRWWSPRARLLHAVVAAGIVAFVVITAWTGML